MPEPINIPEPALNQGQREAIFDLLLLAMYADSNLKISENTRLYDLISGLGWKGYQDPTEYADTATSRVRGASETPEKTQAFLADLNTRLATDEARQFAMILFARLIEVDGHVHVEEDQLYAAAKSAFGV